MNTSLNLWDLCLMELCLEFYLYLKYTLDIIIFFCSQNLFMFVHMWLSGQLLACSCKRHRRRVFDLWVRKLPWRRKWQPSLVLLPEKSYGQRSLAGHSPWGHTESDRTEQTQVYYFRCFKITDKIIEILSRITFSAWNLYFNSPLIKISGD